MLGFGSDFPYVLDDAALEAASDRVIAQFEEANPNIEVTLNNIPDDGEFNKRLAADLAAKTSPDVFAINYRFVGQYAIKGALTAAPAARNDWYWNKRKGEKNSRSG